MQNKDICTFLRRALKQPLPGSDVQWEMASSDRRIRDYPRLKNPGSKLAAVLILLYPRKGCLHTVFIQRPVYNGVHSGQISFPGGKMEKQDSDLSATAIRETCEETGFCDEDIEILGTLSPLYIPVSDIEVTPFVACSASRPEFTPCKNEVVNLIEAPLEFFFDPSIVEEKPMKIRREMLDVKYYNYKGNIIWGATAMILHELTVVLKKV